MADGEGGVVRSWRRGGFPTVRIFRDGREEEGRGGYLMFGERTAGEASLGVGVEENYPFWGSGQAR